MILQMDTPGIGILPFLLLLLGGGGNDLLDYLPTDFYWNQKEAVVSTEMLLKEISPLVPAGEPAKWIDDLSSADASIRDVATEKLVAMQLRALEPLKKEAASEDAELARRSKALITQIISESKPRLIRRLMAIRTLGEMKFAGGLPELRKLSEDPDPFIAEYAAEAIARIEGKPLPPRQPEDLDASMEKDLWLLPESAGAVGQIRLRAGLSPTFEQTVNQQTAFTADQRKQRLQMTGRIVLELAEAVGDVRIDGVTIGVSSDIGEHAGSLTIIARGQFDPAAADVACTLAGAKIRKSGDNDVFFHGPEACFFFPSADHAVLFASALEGDAGTKALGKLTTALKKGKGSLANSRDLPALIEAADRTQPIWAVAKTSPQMRAAPFLSALDTLQLTAAQPTSGRIAFALSGKATDDAGAKQAALEFQMSIDEASKALKPIAEFMKPLRPLRDFLASVRQTTDGSTLKASAELDASMTELFMFSEAPYTEPVDQPPARGEPEPGE